MSNPMKRRKLHRAALAARGEVKETPVAAPVAAPVVTEVIENVPPVSRVRVRRKNAEGSE